MTRISSYAIYQCPDCKKGHILANYVSISVTAAIDACVPSEDLRVCAHCGVVKPFKQFMYAGDKHKPAPNFTPAFIKFLKKLFGLSHPAVEQHPTVIYPYLNQKH